MSDDRILKIERVFDASPDVLYRAWTDPAELVKWWGPQGMQVPEHSLDVRAGGAWRTTMRGGDGSDHICSGTYEELDPPHRLVFTWAWEQDGQRGHETRVTIRFEPDGDKTRMFFEQRLFESEEATRLHNEGWTSSFGCLDECLAA